MITSFPNTGIVCGYVVKACPRELAVSVCVCNDCKVVSASKIVSVFCFPVCVRTFLINVSWKELVHVYVFCLERLIVALIFLMMACCS